MSTYIAFLDADNQVTQVIQSPDDGQDWAAIWAEKFNCKCVVTAKDNSIRGKYPELGNTYYEDIDVFLEPCPYPSWILNKTAKRWDPPVAKPDDGSLYTWEESSQTWLHYYGEQPFPSWSRNTETRKWEPPVARPDDGNTYTWDESSTTWVLYTGP